MEQSDSTLSTFTAVDGDNLAIQEWPLPEGLAPRGVVVLVHGLGEHAGRYDRPARWLNQWGFAVNGYDQYGHGESGGARGGLPQPTRLLDDLADVIESVRARIDRKIPVILFGHSMGGVVAACLVARGLAHVDALVLSSPALDPGLSRFQRCLLATVERFAPRFVGPNGLDPDFLSHNPDTVAAYRADPQVHDRISARLARFIIDAGAEVIAHAPRWPVPTLLMYAGSDRLVNPDGSRLFAQRAPAQIVTAHCFDALFHEILNEADSEPVYEVLRQWLLARF